MNIDNFELFKQNSRTNALDWLRAIPFTSYGTVTHVYDRSTVRVAPIVQSDISQMQEMDVTLLSLSSKTFELSITPQVDDLVLLFSLNKMHPQMFNDIHTRPEAEKILHERFTAGYTVNAMVGILAGTVKGAATLQISVCGALTDIGCRGDITGLFTGNITVGIFPDSEDERTLTVIIGHDTAVSQQAPFTLRFGFKETDPGEYVPVAAPVIIYFSEEAPLEINTEADITINSEKSLFGIFKEVWDFLFEGAIKLISKDSITFKVDGNGLLEIGNNTATLKGLLDEYNDILANFDTVGSPANHMTGPTAKGKLAALKTKQGQVLK